MQACFRSPKYANIQNIFITVIIHKHYIPLDLASPNLRYNEALHQKTSFFMEACPYQHYLNQDRMLPYQTQVVVVCKLYRF